jgi:hypothetical protein
VTDFFEFVVTADPNASVNTIEVSVPEPITVLETVVESAVTAVELDTGMRGPPGPPGPNTSGFQITAAIDLRAGQPVYVDPSGQAAQARADILATCGVVGLIGEDTSAHSIGTVNTQSLELSSWIFVTGSTLLVPGRQYYLGTIPGTLTLVPTDVPGSTVVAIGRAISTTTINLCVFSSILL